MLREREDGARMGVGEQPLPKSKFGYWKGLLTISISSLLKFWDQSWGVGLAPSLPSLPAALGDIRNAEATPCGCCATTNFANYSGLMENAHDMKVVRLNISPFKCVPVAHMRAILKTTLSPGFLLTESDLPCPRNW
jgi:hypothetical protein